jgi:starch-binding outer membrane protein, SusD/RagB family
MRNHLSYTKIIIPLLFCIALIGGGCKKYLYKGPITATYGSEFWTSQTSVEQAALAMYGQLRACLRSEAIYNSGTASFFIEGDLASGIFNPASGDVFLTSLTASSSPAFDFNYVPYGEPVLKNWSRFYQLIAQSNLILQNVPVMASGLFTSEAVRNSYLAEALFVRAYAYFTITRIWGDPVYVTQSYNDVDYGNIPPIARTNESIVLDSCINDLKKAAGFLPFVGGDPAKTIRANAGSTYALLAHIYEWKHDYANAHLACQQVFQHGGYHLEPMVSYTNIWKGQTSSESIFELPMRFNASDPNFQIQGITTNSTDWTEANFNFFGVFLKGTIVDNQKNTCWLIPAGGFVDQFVDTVKDARYKALFTFMPALNGDKAGYMLQKYTNFLYQAPDTKTLPYINNDLVLFRLADIVLLDAEALAYQGDLAGAANDLAQTEGRAGISSYLTPTTQYDMLDEIVIERGRELVGEGQYYYDLIRTEYTQGWLEYWGYPSDGRLNATNKGYYWPLDMGTLFPQDNLLTQNPYWTSHS